MIKFEDEDPPDVFDFDNNVFFTVDFNTYKIKTTNDLNAKSITTVSPEKSINYQFLILNT